MAKGISRIEEIVPGALVRAPATEDTIAMAEDTLGVRLPDELRELYGQTGGFREPVGNSSYLLPLLDDEGCGSLVSQTLFFWNEWPEICQQDVGLGDFIFFGQSGGDEIWAIRKVMPHDIIAYHHSMGENFEAQGNGVLGLFERDFALMQDLS